MLSGCVMSTLTSIRSQTDQGRGTWPTDESRVNTLVSLLEDTRSLSASERISNVVDTMVPNDTTLARQLKGGVVYTGVTMPSNLVLALLSAPPEVLATVRALAEEGLGRMMNTGCVPEASWLGWNEDPEAILPSPRLAAAWALRWRDRPTAKLTHAPRPMCELWENLSDTYFKVPVFFQDVPFLNDIHGLVPWAKWANCSVPLWYQKYASGGHLRDHRNPYEPWVAAFESFGAQVAPYATWVKDVPSLHLHWSLPHVPALRKFRTLLDAA